MQIEDITNMDLGALSDDELAHHLIELSRPIRAKSVKSVKSVKSNKDKQLNDMLSKLSPEQLKKFQALLKGV